MLYYPASLVSVDFVQVIDMSQDVLKVSDLATVSDIVGAWAFSDYADRRAVPLFDD